MKNTKNSTQNLDFTTLKISLSSPEDVLAKSHGEVVKPETASNNASKKPTFELTKGKDANNEIITHVKKVITKPSFGV